MEITEAMISEALEAWHSNVWEDNVPLEECERRDMRAALEAAFNADANT